jgi:hypothetical protein
MSWMNDEKMDELSDERWQQNCCEKLNKINNME